MDIILEPSSDVPIKHLNPEEEYETYIININIDREQRFMLPLIHVYY